MKIALCSDLHLEFQDINIQNTENADVLILSGDILVAEDLHNHPEEKSKKIAVMVDSLSRRQATALRFRDFIKRCSFQFPHVVVIAGNHEFYHGNWKASIQYLRNEYDKFSNIYFLEQEMKTIDDVTFIGATLWTDCNKGDPLTLHASKTYPLLPTNIFVRENVFAGMGDGSVFDFIANEPSGGLRKELNESSNTFEP